MNPYNATPFAALQGADEQVSACYDPLHDEGVDGFAASSHRPRPGCQPKALNWSPDHPVGSIYTPDAGDALSFETDALLATPFPTATAEYSNFPPSAAKYLASLTAFFSNEAAFEPANSASNLHPTVYPSPTNHGWPVGDEDQLQTWPSFFVMGYLLPVSIRKLLTTGENAGSAERKPIPTISTPSPVTPILKHDRAKNTPQEAIPDTRRASSRIKRGAITHKSIKPLSVLPKEGEDSAYNNAASSRRDGGAAGPQTGPASPTRGDSNQQRRQKREAAARYRKKAQDLLDKLEAEEKRVRSEHRFLSVCADRLREELFNLKNEVLRHSDCDCPWIQGYLSYAVHKTRISLAGSETQTHGTETPHFDLSETPTDGS
ncbi:hypothetical protein C7999DRAFT_35188 [Corynascus novoguineensis]|uniref:BZIP domain-containing protein n=1 Tax=Corynascus novoguineensis TaxID=1126955 RepID=A0AAN7HLN1_9PEZI|nr:hypothetical protein C7999DRAFT_35188 [Corynascus novoguineensis]